MSADDNSLLNIKRLIYIRFVKFLTYQHSQLFTTHWVTISGARLSTVEIHAILVNQRKGERKQSQTRQTRSNFSIAVEQAGGDMKTKCCSMKKIMVLTRNLQKITVESYEKKIVVCGFLRRPRNIKVLVRKTCSVRNRNNSIMSATSEKYITQIRSSYIIH